MTEIGYTVIEGLRLPITRMMMRDGKFFFTCQRQGPLPATGEAPSRVMKIFGDDGIVVCQGRTSASWHKVGASEVLDFTVSMRMDECHGDAEVPDGQAG